MCDLDWQQYLLALAYLPPSSAHPPASITFCMTMHKENVTFCLARYLQGNLLRLLLVRVGSEIGSVLYFQGVA